ncbi:MAG: Crp/Fnr family transcriptional regulator [Acidimicrobiia bacterium]
MAQGTGRDEPAGALLARVPMFAGASADVIDRLAACCRERDVDKSAPVFLEGDPGDALYVVVDGLVKISVFSVDGDEAAFRAVGAGGAFGELSALDGAPRSASAIALRPTRLLALPGEVLRSTIRTEPALAELVLRAVAERLRATTHQHADFVFLDLAARVAGYLLERASGSPPTVSIELTQGDLAALLGGSRQSVNQVLRGFETDGVLRRRGSMLEIVDRPRLCERASA